MNVLSDIKRIKYILNGYTNTNAKEYIESKRKNLLKEKTCFNNEDLFWVLPFDKNFDKILNERLSYQYVFKKYKSHLPKLYYVKFERDEKLNYFVHDFENNFSISKFDEIICTLNKEKNFIAINSSIKKKCFDLFSYDGNEYSINGVVVDKDILYQHLNSYGDNTLIMESLNVNAKIINITVLNESGLKPDIITTDENKQYVPLVKTTLLNIAMEIPAIEYMYFTVAINGENFKILSIDTGYDLPYRDINSYKIIEYIISKIIYKQLNTSGVMYTIKKYIFAFIAQRKGFETFMYKNWLRGKAEDYKNTDLSLIKKLWAHKKGFYSRV